MLTVKTSVKPSGVNGLGLFAEEKISKGTVVWKYDSRFDIAFDPEEVKTMPSVQKELIEEYAFLEMKSGKYIYCIDNARFMNHSSVKDNIADAPSPAGPDNLSIAKRDIEIGEELLINYRTFDAADAKSKDSYLNS